MGGSSTPGVQESPLQTAQAQVAQQQWSDYTKRWVPVQNYFSQRTQGGLGAKQQYAEGAANTNIKQSYGKADQQLNASEASRGALAGSNKDIFSTAGLSNDEGTATGAAKTAADASVQRQYEQGLSDIVGMGRGQQATSNQALSTIANLSGEQANESAQAAEQSAAGLWQGAGALGGAAEGYGLGLAGNQNQQQPPAAGLSPSPVGSTG